MKDDTLYNPLLPYPYLPSYSGTTDDRKKIIRGRLRRLLLELQKIEMKFGQDEGDISLLSDIEECNVIVAEILSE